MKRLSVIALGLAVSAGVAQSPVMSAAPANITLAAFADQSTKHLMKALDANHDGKLSEAEWANRKVKPGKTPDFARTFAKLDTDHDGFIDAAELNAMATAKFKKLDKNGDGILNSDERPARKPK